MKFFRIVLLIVTMMILMCACSDKGKSLTTENSEEEVFSISGIYEFSKTENKDVELLNHFRITFSEDGTYSYAESMVASSATTGTWKISDGKLIMNDVAGTNYFAVKKDKLTFINEGSDNFRIVKLKDGDIFTLTK